MISKLALLTIIPLVALTSCATSYQKETFFTNGYSSQKKASNRFVVTFKANEHTPTEKVRQYAFKRASELTLRHGFRYFTVLEEIDASKDRRAKNKAHLHYPSLQLIIQCFHERPADGEAFDANSFL